MTSFNTPLWYRLILNTACVVNYHSAISVSNRDSPFDTLIFLLNTNLLLEKLYHSDKKFSISDNRNKHIKHHIRSFHISGNCTPAVSYLKIHITPPRFFITYIAVSVAYHMMRSVRLVKSELKITNTSALQTFFKILLRGSSSDKRFYIVQTELLKTAF